MPFDIKDYEIGRRPVWAIFASVIIFIALALLPMGADVGTRLHCEMFEYSII